MIVPDIDHRVGIDASAGHVYKALTTIDGLQHWWVVAASGNASAGGVIDFGFTEMKVVRARPGKLVQWRCLSGPREWIGTRVTFRLQRKEGQTFVLFTHGGWRRQVEFMHHCSTKWATFLLSLRELLEQGSGRPAPYDLKIHVDD